MWCFYEKGSLEQTQRAFKKILKLINFFEEARARRISNPSEFETITKGVRGSGKDLKAVKRTLTRWLVPWVLLVVSVIYYFTKPPDLNHSLLVYFFQGAVIAMIFCPARFLSCAGIRKGNLGCFMISTRPS